MHSIVQRIQIKSPKLLKLKEFHYMLNENHIFCLKSVSDETRHLFEIENTFMQVY